MKIQILMSTYNGEKYLQEQLDSLYAQTLPVDILVRDDGSTDGTKKILEENAQSGKLKWYDGENLRSAKSFWDLVHNAPDADYYCFCDQDDFWYKDKVERAVKKLEGLNGQDRPLLYCSNVKVADKELKPLRDMNTGEQHTDFAHSLIYSLAPGCTMVFNAAARNEFIKYDMNREFVIIHDWLAHKITAMLGTVIYDEEPSLLYRQHENNVIGAQSQSKIKLFFQRVNRILTSYANVRSDNAKSLLRIYGDQTTEENKHILDIVANYRTNKKLKKEFLRSDMFVIEKNSYLKTVIRFNKV